MTSSQTFVAASLLKITVDPGQPRLTWYGPDFERIELSGAVLNNWVNKTTNLLVEEFESEPGIEICLALPAHWRSLVWSMATLLTGSTLSLATPSGSAAALVTDQPDSQVAQNRSKQTDLVAVTLGALARKYPGKLPTGAIDAASAVMTYGDSIWQSLSTQAPLPAIRFQDLEVPFSALPDWASPSSADRYLIRCTIIPEGFSEHDAALAHADSLLGVLQQCLGIWAAGGSAVILGSHMCQELESDPARLERLIASERITAGVNAPPSDI